jgi:hypothetical protein
MKKAFLGGIGTALLLVASAGQGTAEGTALHMPRLSAEYAKRRDQVLPSPGEQSYRKIAWRTSVLQGVIDAQKKDRPVMIVLMNGHPLGCT